MRKTSLWRCCIFNGRPSIVDEIAASDVLRDGLAAKFRAYLQSQDVEDAVEGFAYTERQPERCKHVILERFRAIAAL